MQFVFEVTQKCPALCSFCPLRGGRGTGVIPLDIYALILDALQEVDPEAAVVISGGEPSVLGKQLSSYVEEARKRGFWVTVVTNAFDPDAVLAAAPDLVEVSIDYFGDRHDKERGLPLWLKAVRLVIALRGRGVVIRSTVFPDNINDILKLKALFPDVPIVAMPVRGAGVTVPEEALRRLEENGVFLADDCPAGRRQIVFTPSNDGSVVALPCIFYRKELGRLTKENVKEGLQQVLKRGRRVPKRACER
ncbi:MAG: radical SAM protein [Fervidicoccaceae archaeon]